MRKLALIIPALIALGGGVAYFKVIGSEIALLEKYPDVDPQVVIKVHRGMVRDTLAGKFNHIDLTDENCEKIFETRLMYHRF